MAYVIASTVGLDQSGLVIMSLVCVFTAALVGLMYQFGRYLLEALGPIGNAHYRAHQWHYPYRYVDSISGRGNSAPLSTGVEKQVEPARIWSDDHQ